MMDTRRGQGSGEDLHANRTSRWQSIRAKARNRIRVGWKAGKIVRIRRKRIDDAAVWQGLRAVPRSRGILNEGRENHQSRIIHDVGRNGDLFAVIAEAVTAAHHQLVVEASRTPGNTDLRSKVVLLCVPRIALADDQAREVVRPSAGDGAKHVVFLGIQRTIIRPAKANVDG